MGLRNDVTKLVDSRFTVVTRTDMPAVGASMYTNATYTLFTILGGPVLLQYLNGRVIGAAGLASGSTFHLHVCGANASSAAANANTMNNGIIHFPLDAGKNTAFNALAVAVVTLAVSSKGMVASIGLIELVAAGGATTVNIGVEWTLAYRKLHPQSIIV